MSIRYTYEQGSNINCYHMSLCLVQVVSWWYQGTSTTPSITYLVPDVSMVALFRSWFRYSTFGTSQFFVPDVLIIWHRATPCVIPILCYPLIRAWTTVKAPCKKNTAIILQYCVLYHLCVWLLFFRWKFRFPFLISLFFSSIQPSIEVKCFSIGSCGCCCCAASQPIVGGLLSSDHRIWCVMLLGVLAASPLEWQGSDIHCCQNINNFNI